MYAGPKGSWTPLHRDVFRSYSWSSNLVGEKLWLFFPPECEIDLLIDANEGEDLKLFDVRELVAQVPTNPWAERLMKQCIPVIQKQGDTIFVPSNWFHQVHNLQDTVSINHNWFNGFSIPFVWANLAREHTQARNMLQGFQFKFAGQGNNSRKNELNKKKRDMDEDMEEQVQVVLKAANGMNFVEFWQLLVFTARSIASRMWERLSNRESECKNERGSQECDACAVFELARCFELLVANGTEGEREMETMLHEGSAKRRYRVSIDVFSLRRIATILKDLEEKKAVLTHLQTCCCKKRKVALAGPAITSITNAFKNCSKLVFANLS